MEEHEERDDWVERAMKDDCLGAEILMAFTRRPPTPPPTPPPPPPADDLVLDVVRQQPLKWCEKKSRWTPIDVSEIRKFKEEYEKEGGKPSVASPQSPLSWSGGDGGPKKNGGKRRASAAASDKGKSKVNSSSYYLFPAFFSTFGLGIFVFFLCVWGCVRWVFIWLFFELTKIPF